MWIHFHRMWVGRELGRRRCAGSVVLLVCSQPPVSSFNEKRIFKKFQVLGFHLAHHSPVLPLDHRITELRGGRLGDEVTSQTQAIQSIADKTTDLITVVDSSS
jgi:hypothetical protein